MHPEPTPDKPVQLHAVPDAPSECDVNFRFWMFAAKRRAHRNQRGELVHAVRQLAANWAAHGTHPAEFVAQCEHAVTCGGAAFEQARDQLRIEYWKWLNRAEQYTR